MWFDRPIGIERVSCDLHRIGSSIMVSREEGLCINRLCQLAVRAIPRTSLGL